MEVLFYFFVVTSDFLTCSLNSAGDVEKGVVAKKRLQPGNLNENSPQGWNFRTLLFSAEQELCILYETYRIIFSLCETFFLFRPG